MSKRIRVRGVRQKELDTDQLALAYLMLARILRENDEAEAVAADEADALLASETIDDDMEQAS